MMEGEFSEEDAGFDDLRNEYIDSFTLRLNTLKHLTGLLVVGQASEKDIEEISIVVHRLAGSAGSFGFPTLSWIAGEIEDFLDICGRPADRDKLAEVLSVLADALSLSIQSRVDPISFKDDVRIKLLAQLTHK